MSTNQTARSIIGVLLHRLIIRTRSLNHTHQTIHSVVLIIGHLAGGIDNAANLPGCGIREMRAEPQTVRCLDNLTGSIVLKPALPKRTIAHTNQATAQIVLVRCHTRTGFHTGHSTTHVIGDLLHRPVRVNTLDNLRGGIILQPGYRPGRGLNNPRNPRLVGVPPGSIQANGMRDHPPGSIVVIGLDTAFSRNYPQHTPSAITFTTGQTTGSIKNLNRATCGIISDELALNIGLLRRRPTPGALLLRRNPTENIRMNERGRERIRDLFNTALTIYPAFNFNTGSIRHRRQLAVQIIGIPGDSAARIGSLNQLRQTIINVIPYGTAGGSEANKVTPCVKSAFGRMT